MQTKHLLKRGSRYIYRCRVPLDLLSHFPSPLIWKNLKTNNEKDARLAASAVEYRTQQLFLKLRTGMLPKELERQLVAEYLKEWIRILDLTQQGQLNSGERRMIALSQADGCTVDEAQDALAKSYSDKAASTKRSLARATVDTATFAVKALEARVRNAYNIKIAEPERRSLALQVTNINAQVAEARSALLCGDWSLLEQLKKRVETDLASPYYDLKSVCEKYQEWYLNAKPNLKQGSKDDMVVECRVLLEIFGNISIAQFNSMESVTLLQRILRKYPKNKQQRFGEKSIHSILKERKTYEVIHAKTANNYIDRAKAVVSYAAKCRFLDAANVYEGARFPVSKAAEEERSAYSTEDINRLIDALCCQPLYSYSAPKPERFWIILIALLHGFRLGNIIDLTKEDICQTDKGTWVFMLRRGKTRSTIRPVAICDTLRLLGFLEWVEALPRKRLFQDNARSFGAWYNRNEVQKNGKPSLGFEARHVTADRAKCLYSLRHSFAGNVFEVTEDYKITADMMGHSTQGSVTARYVKATKAEALKQVSDKMAMEHIDLDKLEARAQELFFT